MKDDQGVLWYKGRICVPKIKGLKDKMFREVHESAYSIHPGGNKKYNDHKAICWCYGMKVDVAEYVALLRHLSESKPSINDPLGCCNLCKHLSGSRKRLLWISSWDCLGLSLEMIPFGKLWTDLPR
jgi:hypothetical protein